MQIVVFKDNFQGYLVNKQIYENSRNPLGLSIFIISQEYKNDNTSEKAEVLF